MGERAGLADKYTAHASSPVHVLLVEDIAFDRELITKRLSEWRIIVDEATSKQDAIALASTREFDLAMVDQRLPWEGNGVSVMKALRAKNPLIPICAYSGVISGADVAKICREIGPVTIADKAELMRGNYIVSLLAQCRLASRAGMTG